MIQKLKKSKKGFTLIEMLVVIAIIAILVSIIIPVVGNSNAKAKAAANAANLRSLKAEVITMQLTGEFGTGKTYADASAYVDARKDDISFYHVDSVTNANSGLKVEVPTGDNANTNDITITWDGLTINQWANAAGNETAATPAA